METPFSLDDSYPANSLFVPGPANVRYYLYHHTGLRLRAAPVTSARLDPSNASYVVLGKTSGFDRGTAIAGPVVGRSADAQELVTHSSHVRSHARSATTHRYVDVAVRSGPRTIHHRRRTERARDRVRRSILRVEERDATERWRWTSGPSAIAIRNDTSRRRQVSLTFSLRAIERGRTLVVSGPGSERSRIGLRTHHSTLPSIGLWHRTARGRWM